MYRRSFPGAHRRAALLSLALVPILAAALALTACGGGYSSSKPMAANSMVTMGAIKSMSQSSMTVNATQFQMAGATVAIDGQPGQESDLKVGDVVQVKSHHDDGSGDDMADEVDFRGAVQGPVTSIDPTTQTLIVLGQSVVLSAATSFDEDISPASIAGITLGDILEVSGMTASDGSIHATRIEIKPPGTPFRVLGTASSTDANAKTLHINALVVDFSGATLDNFPASGPADGDLIEASGTTLEASGALQAQRLEQVINLVDAEDQNEGARIEGLITRFASATDFDVAGHPVSTSATTEFENGTAASLALNAHVEVEGTVDAHGVLQANKVAFEGGE